MYCLIQIPCECSFIADDFQIPSRLSACTDLSDVDNDVVYPGNIAILQQFFNTSAIQHILATSVFTKPVQYSVPQLDIAEHEFQNDLERGTKLDADLATVAKKMKAGEKIYRQLSTYSVDDLWLDSPNLDSWPTVLGLVGFGLSVTLFALTLVKSEGTLVDCWSPHFRDTADSSPADISYADS